MTDKIKMRK